MKADRTSIHFEIPGTSPLGGIPQLACKAAYRKRWRKDEITHTRKASDVNCQDCKASAVWIMHSAKLQP